MNSTPLASAANTPLTRVGTWNVSGWTPDKLGCVNELHVQVLAVQETHLSLAGLQKARFEIEQRDWVMHHGHPAPTKPGQVHSHSCGVGFLVAAGVAVARPHVSGGDWAWLHEHARVSVVDIPKRADLPNGFRLVSVYAPVANDRARCEVFCRHLMSWVASLDMQVPTLLLGDFNGSVDPPRDFSNGAKRAVSSLLLQLLNPLGPFFDLQMAVSPDLWDFTFVAAAARNDNDPDAGLSRIDLALGNQAAVGLVERVFVAVGTTVFEHQPVLVDLRCRPLALQWYPPRPRRLPPDGVGAA